jgi:hypothetical protein
LFIVQKKAKKSGKTNTTPELVRYAGQGEKEKKTGIGPALFLIECQW